MTRLSVLVLGASYGSLLASKVLLAGHTVKLVCLPAEARLINEEGTRVRVPVRGRTELVEIDSRAAPGRLSADVPEAVDAAEYDLVGLAMQEPQYGSVGVRELVGAVAAAGVPCVSIMNMPPLPFLARLPGVDVGACRDCYADPEVWDGFDPAVVTLCSPDPRAFRPADERENVLQVRLATNFKAARFASDADTALLRELESGIAAIDLPVKLRVHDSVFVPLAKWAMLIAGNYRCVQEEGIRSIGEAVHDDLAATRAIYDWVAQVCMALGAAERDLVAFAKYAEAAKGLDSPSSVARAVVGGAQRIERVDRLVRELAAQKGMRSDVLDQIVTATDARLEANRTVAA